MTGIRTSCVFKPETSFGVETDKGWYRLPSGLSFDFTPKNGMQTYYEIGNKFPDRAVAGRFSGTWTIRCKLDYEIIGFLGIAFESYKYENNVHKFGKVNGKRPPSMTLRGKQLNRMVGGSKDATTVLLGCVCDSISLSMSGANSATVEVNLSGSYADQYDDYSELEETDWQDFYDEDSAVPVEWVCLRINDEPIAYTKSISFSVRNSLSMQPACGSRFSQNYGEGQASISLSTSVWSVKPETYIQKMYSGGFDSTKNRPMKKGLKPIPKISLVSVYDTNDDDTADYSFTLNLYDVYVDSVGHSWNSGSEIVDSPSLIPMGFDIEFKNKSGKLTLWGE